MSRRHPAITYDEISDYHYMTKYEKKAYMEQLEPHKRSALLHHLHRRAMQEKAREAQKAEA